MKKILILSNVLLLGIILFMACNSGSPKEKIDTTKFGATKPEKKDCLSEICMDYTDRHLEGEVNGDLLRDMSEAYADDKSKSRIDYASKGDKAPKDALSITFDLEKIKHFIWNMETGVCRAGCKGKTLGIRFYYIKYPQGVDTSDVPADLETVLRENANKHALAMVPAYLGSDRNWYDFDYNMLTEGSCDLAGSIPPPKKGKGKSVALISIGSGTNHGGIGPPPDPGTYPSRPE